MKARPVAGHVYKIYLNEFYSSELRIDTRIYEGSSPSLMIQAGHVALGGNQTEGFILVTLVLNEFIGLSIIRYRSIAIPRLTKTVIAPRSESVFAML